MDQKIPFYLTEAFSSGSCLGATPDFCSLVSHSNGLRANDNLEGAYGSFNNHPHDFIAVLEAERIIGIISRREVSMILGSRFGWELFGKNRIRDHLEPSYITIRDGSPIVEVLSAVFSAEGQCIFNDIVLVGRNGEFLGFITILSMIKLQHWYLLDNITVLEQSQQELKEKNKRNEEDLSLARELQMALLPQKSSHNAADSVNRNLPHFFYHYAPANTVGGDFCIVQQLTPKLWGVFICDVMGHGVRSALVTTMIRALFEELRDIASDPGELLTGINKNLTRIFRQADDGLFVTALYMVLSAEGEIRYAKAGHHDPVLVDAERRKSRAITSDADSGGAPLGIFADTVYTTISGNVDAGSMIILFTDGLFEIEDPEQNSIGYDNLLRIIAAHCALPPEEMVGAVLDDITRITGGSPFDDDICLVGIAFPPSPAV